MVSSLAAEFFALVRGCINLAPDRPSYYVHRVYLPGTIQFLAAGLGRGEDLEPCTN